MQNVQPLRKMWGDLLMLKNIRQKIRETVNEAVDAAIRAVEVSNEGMIIHASIPKSLKKATVVIEGQKRPFKLSKLETIIRAFRGKWNKVNTACDFTKVESLRHSSAVSLKMRFYTGECLNPTSKVEVFRGSRGRVLDRNQCDGAENSIMQGLGISNGREKEA